MSSHSGARGKLWSSQALGAAVALAVLAQAGMAADTGPLKLKLRTRVESPDLGGASRVVETSAAWESNRTVIIVCDMWDLHHCLNATRRGAELAPRMDEVLTAARGRGVLVIHAPSSCMDAYKDHPARRRALAVTRSKSLPQGIGQWCKQIPAEERSSYPVDQTNGGEDDDLAEHDRWQAKLASLGRDPKAPWKSETEKLTIDPEKDLISDSGEEIWSALEERGIDNVILLGVHTNMCVLGRPFGLRQMAKNGKNVVLMRDMTDTMYDPKSAPYVSHFTGTDRVVEHVERYVCPTVTSDQLIGGRPFRFKDDRRPRVAFLVSEDEYKTETTLPPFAASLLGKNFNVSFVFDRETDKNELMGLSAIDDADVLFVSMRRRVLPAAQLAAIQRQVARGKGVVGIRTASHAFSLRGKEPAPEGRATWPEFDAQVLGGNYVGHHAASPKVAVSLASGAAGHPILTGVDVASLIGNGTLYRVSPLASSATALLSGSIPGQPAEPIAWTNLTSAGGRVFYSSLGHVDDFKLPAFQRLLRNALDWTAGRAVPAKVETTSLATIPFPK
jgi:type 1 glutamine amidotransferase/nicotinamidase-related amidase